MLLLPGVSYLFIFMFISKDTVDAFSIDTLGLTFYRELLFEAGYSYNSTWVTVQHAHAQHQCKVHYKTDQTQRKIKDAAEGHIVPRRPYRPEYHPIALLSTIV